MPLIISADARAPASYSASDANAQIAGPARCSLPKVDFNGDGYADLAVGIPGEDVGSVSNAGAVQVLYGSASGLSASGNQLWYQDSPGIEGTAETDDNFGEVLATGDFNGDGKTDLAIGVRFEDVLTSSGDQDSAGVVHILYGSASGLSASGNQLWHQDSPGIEGVVEAVDHFGAALSAGDFNGDGKTDLAIGVHFEHVLTPSGTIQAGAVQVLYGSASGLSASGNQLWHQDSPGIEGEAEDLDSFGWALSTGDFNGDGKADLAVSVLGEDLGAVVNVGVVNVLYGSESGLTASGSQLWHQDSPGIEDVAEAGDRFGFSLAAGDFNGDGRADLAAGVHTESFVGASGVEVLYAGAVNVLYGSASGLTASGNQLWHQDSPGVADVAERDDQLGSVLATGDFNGDGKADLAMGVFFESILTPIDGAGVVNVLYGSASGLTASGNQLWHQDSPGIEGIVQAGDAFGHGLTTGDFNGDGETDLAVGAPGEAILTPSGDQLGAGVVNVLYGSASGLTESGNQLWHQDSPSIEGVVEAGDAFGSSLR